MLATWTVLSVALLATGSFAQIGSLSLNPGLYDLQWDCNPTDNVIVFNISVQAQGWVGFGISPDGNMNNSDVVILLRNGSLLVSVHFIEIIPHIKAATFQSSSYEVAASFHCFLFL